MAAAGYRRPDVRVLKRAFLYTTYFLPLSFEIRKNVGVVENFVECGVGVDIGAVCVSLVYDLSGYVCEDNEWVILRKVRDVYYGCG